MNPITNSITTNSALGFAAGWLAGSAVIATGKAYIVLTSSQHSVHHLLGHCGTPSFRRELAIAGTFYAFAATLVHLIGKNLNRPVRQRHFLANAIALPLAFLAGNLITHNAYATTFTIAVVGLTALGLNLVKRS